MVTIVISYQTGTAEMLDVCLESLRRYTRVPVTTLVITTKVDDELTDICTRYDAVPMEVDVPLEPMSRLHGRMLDSVIPSKIETEYVLTLDSDCFPIADGWLAHLLDIAKNDAAKVVGIAHPFAPPPEDMLKVRMLWRVWSQHNWNNTHVACQLLRVSDLKELDVSYAGGDDTGLLIPNKAHSLGWFIMCYRPTRCPKPAVPGNASSGVSETLDPEFNRLNCVVFGDMMCHVGAYSRGKAGSERPGWEHFDWAVKRILDEKGAEFLLEDRLSYCYQFDREREVAQHKLDRMLGVGADGRSLRQP